MDTPLFALPSGDVPETSVPMKLPWMTLSVAVSPLIMIPSAPLAEITFRAADDVPPIVVLGARVTQMP